MPHSITTLTLPLPLRMGTVNCYLIRTADGCVLIDTGGSNARADLRAGLERAGCTLSFLRLILLTHGDFDHIGGAADLRAATGAPIAMGRDDAAMAERGDMFANRKRPNALVRTLIPVITGFGPSRRFTPDILLDDGYDLSPFGLEARVLGLPGHSAGSIGVLTAAGDLFCGDLFENTKAPALNSLLDDPAAAQASAVRLAALPITFVYPGHGRPFALEQLNVGREP
jgi:hydroxyacylglutathione hydrolase